VHEASRFGSLGIIWRGTGSVDANCLTCCTSQRHFEVLDTVAEGNVVLVIYRDGIYCRDMRGNTKLVKDPRPVTDLYGTVDGDNNRWDPMGLVRHSGSEEGGHFTFQCRRKDVQILMNDDRVSQVVDGLDLDLSAPAVAVILQRTNHTRMGAGHPIATAAAKALHTLGGQSMLLKDITEQTPRTRLTTSPWRRIVARRVAPNRAGSCAFRPARVGGSRAFDSTTQFTLGGAHHVAHDLA
jgi:hypothetical protein